MRISFVDVFGTTLFSGNGLAVVHDAAELDAAQMQDIARWTKLSETTFLLPPSQPGADYRVRIFTPGAELPFAGHPTLGSAYAWIAAGGQPADGGVVVQESGAELTRVRFEKDALAFAAPSLIRSGPVEDATRDRVIEAAGVNPKDVLDVAWCDNGPGWVGIHLTDAQAVLAATPRPDAFRRLAVGLIGSYAEGERSDGVSVEVRAFYGDAGGFMEDPATGSLNAALAQWLVPTGAVPSAYVAAQGQKVGRDTRIYLTRSQGEVWVGGRVQAVVSGPMGS